MYVVLIRKVGYYSNGKRSMLNPSDMIDTCTCTYTMLTCLLTIVCEFIFAHCCGCMVNGSVAMTALRQNLIVYVVQCHTLLMFL